MKLHSIRLAPRLSGLSRTLVLLHGYGADEHDLISLAHELDPRLQAISLQAPLLLGQGGRAWFNVDPNRGGFSFDAGEVARAGVLVAEALEEIASQSPRPLLLGFSQGAGVALGVALSRPELCGGVLSLSGLPPQGQPEPGPGPQL